MHAQNLIKSSEKKLAIVKIYIYNYIDPAEGNLLYQAYRLINSQIYARNVISPIEKDCYHMSNL